jgi:hypothetical protein
LHIFRPITSITLPGANASQFSQINTCGTSVAASTSCAITVVFRPTSTGAKTATIRTVVGGGAGTKTASLTGTGIVPTYSLTPATIAFGNQARGTISAAQTITHTNTSSLALPITSIALAGTNPWAILADQHLRRRSECGRNLHDQRGVSSDLHWG